MFKNYLITSARHLARNRVFSAVNILGLSLAMTACLLIFKYIHFEKSYDNFHENADSLYRLTRHYESWAPGEGMASIFPAIAPNSRENFPEIKASTRFVFPDKMFFSFAFSYFDPNGNVRTFNETDGFFADHDALTMFDHQWIEGTGQLDEPNQIVLSETVAARYFGNEPAVGKVLNFSNTGQIFEVTGVFRDLPENTHLKYNLLCSFLSLPDRWGLDNDWGWGNFYTYFLLEEGTNPELLSPKLHDYLYAQDTFYEEEGTIFDFQPIRDIHLNSHLTFEMEANGNARTLFFLSTIGVFIMLIAWVNFVNLSTAKLVDRSKEVGIRRVLGSARHQLMGQFLSESLLLNGVAIVFSLTLLQLSAGFFQEMLGIPLHYFSGKALTMTLQFISIFVLGAAIFGLYPSLLLSGQNMTQALKGKSKRSKNGFLLRRGLIIFQYAIASMLIFGTISVFNQLKFLQNQSLGMNMEQTLVIKSPFVELEQRNERKNTFKRNLVNYSQVQSASSSSEIPGYEITRMRGIRWTDAEDSPGSYAKDISVDEHFIDQYEIKLLAGRGFSADRDDSRSLVINESLAKELEITEYESAIGQRVHYLNEWYTIIGVIEDFHQVSLRDDSEAQIFSYDQRTKFYSVKIAAGNVAEALAVIEDEFHSIFPNAHFDYFFLDQYFNRQYRSDQLFGKIFGFFAVLAIIVTVLGLFGLATYTMAQRIKEICIRKVLGASMINISRLLVKEYLWLILVASFVAAPVAYYLMDDWLDNFAVRLNPGPMVFFIPVIVIGILTLLIVGRHVLRAALTNPSESLRHE